MHYKNPVMRGFNPDPSFCRVGDDYYLVTSTFEFFPGVPIYHSKNLVDWELISHCLTSNSQLPLDDAATSKGIYAPTIRYNNGTYYMTTTNISMGNFIVYTDDIRGKWSEPVLIKQAGIDPSLYFEDGKVYFISNYRAVPNGISMAQIDPKTGEFIVPTTTIGTGTGGRCCEAPHVFKRGEYYYLMMAEGGAEYGHMVTIKRSKNLWGPYDESCPRNPILTHRDYKASNIQATGHADFVEDANGNWWAVFLGIRAFGRTMLHQLGRETFLAPVVWDDDGWPVIGNNGTVEAEMDGPLPGPAPKQSKISWDGALRSGAPVPGWIFIRGYDPKNYEFDTSGVTIKASKDTLCAPMGYPSVMLRRQQDFETITTAAVDLCGCEDMLGGLTFYLNPQHHYDLYVRRESGKIYAGVKKCVYDIAHTAFEIELFDAENIELRVVSEKTKYNFELSINGNSPVRLGSGTACVLCSEITEAMNFTGTLCGIYCEKGAVKFTDFQYTEL